MRSFKVHALLTSFFTPQPPRWYEVVLLAVILSLILCTGLSEVRFHGDESEWIHSSFFFEYYIRADFSSSVWGESGWTLTQPPLARYIIGLGRTIGGYRLTDLNQPWDWNLDLAGNTAAGRVPSPGLLWWSRLPMTLLAVSSLMIGFYLVTRSAGRLASYLFLLLSVTNELMRTSLRRAMGEAPLLAGILLAALVGQKALEHVHTDDRRFRSPSTCVWSIFWFSLVGLASGAAGASKLNGLSSAIAGIALAGVGMLLQSGWSCRTRFLFAATAAVVVFCAASVAFIGLNPFLYPDPIARTVRMIQFRMEAIRLQEQQFYFQRIDDFSERLTLVPQRVLEEFATLRFRGSEFFNLALSLLGLVHLFLATRTGIFRGGDRETSITLVLFLVITGGPSLLTPLDWDRYYLLPVFFSTLLISIGLSWLVRLAYGVAASIRIR